MSDKNGKKYCVIDHANKLGDRSGANPNRLRRVKAARFRAIEIHLADLRSSNKKPAK